MDIFEKAVGFQHAPLTGEGIKPEKQNDGVEWNLSMLFLTCTRYSGDRAQADCSL